MLNALRPCLLPLTPLFRAGVALRDWGYRSGRLRQERLRAPVVSVGNLVVGGTGKTPVVACLAREFRDRGHRVSILSRGYGRNTRGVQLVSDGSGPRLGPDAAGDEPYLLARELEGVVVVVGESRHLAGELAERRFGCDLHLLDDGFQHRSLVRDLDILLLDSAGTGRGLRMLPAGTLREPLSSMARADIVLLTRAHHPHDEVGLRRLVRQYNPDAPVFTVLPRFPGLRTAAWADCDLSQMIGRRVLALSAIGDPRQFEDDLVELGAVLVGRMRLRDHHRFGVRDVAAIERELNRVHADLVITTLKDLVRLAGPDAAHGLLPPGLPLLALRMEAVVRDAPEVVRRLATALVPALRTGQ